MYLDTQEVVIRLVEGKVLVSDGGLVDKLTYRLKDGKFQCRYLHRADNWSAATGSGLNEIVRAISEAEADAIQTYSSSKPKTVTVELSELQALKDRIADLEKTAK